MKPDTRLRRHSTLWKAGTASVRRTAAGGTIFAILILLRVVEPYHDTNAQGELDLKELRQTKVELTQRKAHLTRIKNKLDEIEVTISEEPWNVEIEELIKYFEERWQGTSTNVRVPKDRANETIDNIVKMVRKDVVDELRDVVTSAGASEEVAAIPNKIERTILDWKTKNYDKAEWYFTPQSKRRTIEGMSAVLSDLRADATAAVQNSDDQLKKLQINVDADTKKITADIRIRVKSIKADVNKILPSWASGLVGAKAMVLLYPWILVAIAAYLVGSALVAARHFHGMADEEGWTDDERSDPLLSSPWTLTKRGLAGTSVTLFNYGAVLAVLSYFLIRALNPHPTTKQQSDTDAAAEYSDVMAESISSVLPTQLAYGLMVAVIFAVIYIPLRRRAK